MTEHPGSGRKLRAYLGLGSNTGDSAGILRRAVDELSTMFDDPRVSSFYRTRPRDDVKQPDFLNAVFSGVTDKEALEVLRIVQILEEKSGRRRDPDRPKGPRTLDIDILLYGDLRIYGPELEIPHPRMRERKFVLVPLLELDPLVREPATGIYYGEYAAKLEDQGIYYISLNHYSTTLSWEDRAEGYGSKYGNQRKQ